MIKSKLYITVLSAALASTISYAEPTITGKITHEAAKFTGDGNLIGNHSGGGVIPANSETFKSETSARIYIDGEFENSENGATYHVELQGFKDGAAINNYDDNESNTQRDPLREAYIDTSYDDILIRAGKQQVVWGTADGIKLLDAINPTDYSELVQNQMEDSRIPVWMINAETDLESGGNIQFVVSEQSENKIPGLNSSGDVGHPFIMKGVDSITGKRNGFLNITPELASVANTFHGAAANGGFATSASTGSNTLATFSGFTVDAFSKNYWYPTASKIIGLGQSQTVGGTTHNGTAVTATTPGTTLLYNYASMTNGSTNQETNLVNKDSSGNVIYNGLNPTSTFEYMTAATFATFNTLANATSEYVKDSKAQDGANIGWRYKNTTDDGLNYSFNLMRKADANPYIEMDWYSAGGTKLTTELWQAKEAFQHGGSGPAIYSGSTTYGTQVNREDVDHTLTTYQAAQPSSYTAYNGGNTNATTVHLTDGINYYGKVDPLNPDGTYANFVRSGTTFTAPVLRMTEKSNDVTVIGGSFDTSIDTEALGPVVIRGEATYTKDEMTPVINRGLLAIGDLTGGLQMEKADMLRYVVGLDITALTNMMISTQFIQMRNLDYVDTPCTGTTGYASYDCSKYTGDMATMHLTNGLNKAKKNKEFYSLYLSKPFGESGQHRWNNIFMLEEGGGKWNRLDVEYTIDDNTVATAEYNKYFGNENTQFGQFKNSSNVQLGVKYTF